MDVEYEGRGEFALSCDDKLVAGLGAAKKKSWHHWLRHGNHDCSVVIGILSFCPNCDLLWSIDLEFACNGVPLSNKNTWET
jgi:hypothetical protein